MACASLTQDLPRDCGGNIGGISEIYITNKSNVVSKTVVAGVITAIEMIEDGRYYKWDMPRNTAELKEDTKINEENGTQYEEQTVDMVFNKLQTNIRNEILLAGYDVTDVIVKDKNGKYWNPGFENGMQISAKTAGTGKAKGDRNGMTLQLKGEEAETFHEVNSAIVAALLIPAV